ncbi:MAG TPA: SDR family oxidoreductase [Mycobacteriales bacterium]|nr:SDR family oxidoreductase [Mycobacteriales bacterium]
MTRYDGKVVIITGASRGIGAGLGRAFHEAGARVVLAARSADALTALAEELGDRALAVPTDVTDPASVEHLVDITLARFGRLDAAINNASGGGAPPTPIAHLPIEAFDSAISVALRGVFLSMRYEIPAMLATGGGAIVNMSSTAGLQGIGGIAGYVTAKHGVIGLTRSAAIDYAEKGIRINAIAPGPIGTGQNRGSAESARRVSASLPIGRVGTVGECADVLKWLCSDAASFVTGTTVTVDGGMLAGMKPYARS